MHLKKFILTALAFIIFNSFAYGQAQVNNYNQLKNHVNGNTFFNILITRGLDANDDLGISKRNHKWRRLYSKYE